MASILVFEPSGNLRLLIEEELREGGHSVRATATAAEARACLAQEQPDLAIVEAAPGDSEALELLAHLLGASRGIPVIIHTASSRLAGGLLASLADASVLKSSDLKPLAAAVDRVLRRSTLFHSPWRAVDFSPEAASLNPSAL